MIYVTGSSGLVGKRFLELYEGPITTISYRDEPIDLFQFHENSCLIHCAWSSGIRNSYNDYNKFIKYDVINSEKIFNFYSKKNPNGKIIFLSSAPALYTEYKIPVDENFIVNPRTLYGDLKIRVEDILKTIDCRTVALRISNVWGGKELPSNRINGLIDKLFSSINTENVIEIYASLNNGLDIIHVDDVIELIKQCIQKDLDIKHEMFVAGSESVTLKEILDKISSLGYLNIKLHKKDYREGYLNINNNKVSKTFNWKPKIKLI